MKQWFLLTYCIMVSILSYGQKIDWKKTKNWRLYALNKDAAFSYPVDTLTNFKGISMEDSAVISFLSQSQLWPKSKYAHWMGMYFGSYETADGYLRKVVFSSYGGFVYDSFTKRYYELPRGMRKSWNDFLNENLKKVFED